jgi:polyhydroxyalkanoate synthase
VIPGPDGQYNVREKRESQMTERNTVPSSVEEIFDKYVEGIKIISQGAQADTGQTPKEVIWTKNKAKL